MSWLESRPKFDRNMGKISIDKDTGMHYIEQDVNIMASFCQGGDSNHIPFTFARDGMCSGAITAASPYFKKSYSNMQELVGYFENDWTFPLDLLEQARGLSCELMYVLQSDNNPRVIRKQESGKLDMNAMSRTMRDIELGRFSSETTRPFKRRLKGASSRPSVGVVIQGDYRFMWNKDKNIPNCVVAGLAISWAAQALDCRVNTFISNTGEGHGKPNHSLNIKIVSDDDSIPIHNLGTLLHRDLFRCSTGNAAVHHKDMYPYFDNDGNHCSGSTGHGLTYLKKFYNADILIGIGSHGDAHLADAVVTDISNPLKVVHKVAELLAKKLKVAA